MKNEQSGRQDRKLPKVGLLKKTLIIGISSLMLALLFPIMVFAVEPTVAINGNGMDTLEVLLMLTIIGLLPSILIMMTCFTRVIIILSFLRNAMGLQQTPPNQVLIGIALFLSLFIMSPVITEINDTAYQPYRQEQITQEEFLDQAAKPLKTFMLNQTKDSDLDTFARLAKMEPVETKDDIPMLVVIPAFMSAELKRAFTAGFLLYIPFLVIDMIVSSTLMSMGMIMLPPVMISMPFKLLLFILVDGWNLLFKTIALTFHF